MQPIGHTPAVARSRAFTLIELLVVIGIIGILVGMLVPAISSARESARRTQCSNRIKQIGVALAGYESTASRYPAGVASHVWYSMDKDDTALDERAKHRFYYWTYFLHTLLPRLEEQTYYDNIGGPLFRRQPFENMTGGGQKNIWWSAVNRVPLPSLMCPSDGQAGSVWIPTETILLEDGQVCLAKSNYLGFFSGTTVAESLAWVEPTVNPGDVCQQRAVHPLPPPGAFFYVSGSNRTFTDRRAVFGYGVGTPLRAVKDGTAYTIAMAEYLRGVSDRDGRGAFWYNLAGMQSLQATTTPNSQTPDVLVRRMGDTAKVAPEDWGCSDLVGTAVTQTPNNRPDLNLPCVGGPETNFDKKGLDNFAAARSRHRGGVNVLFVDGHVSFINDTIDGSAQSPYGTWQRLVWIDDGNSVDGQW